jgi:hypothetical protein
MGLPGSQRGRTGDGLTIIWEWSRDQQAAPENRAPRRSAWCLALAIPEGWILGSLCRMKAVRPIFNRAFLEVRFVGSVVVIFL